MLLEPGPIPAIDATKYQLTFDPPDFEQMTHDAWSQIDSLTDEMDSLIDPAAIFDDALDDDGMSVQLDALDQSNGDNAASINLGGMDVGDGMKAEGDHWLTLAIQAIPGEAWCPVPDKTEFGTVAGPAPTARIAGVTLLDLTTMSGTDFHTGDQYQLQVKMDTTTGHEADVLAVHVWGEMNLNQQDQANLEIGDTDWQGLVTYRGQWGFADAGNWTMWVHAVPTTGGDVMSQLYQWTVLEGGRAPLGPSHSAVMVQLQNTSSGDISNNHAGDNWVLSVTGPPSAPVYIWAWKDGQALPEVQLGDTDATGTFNLPGAWLPADVGDWTEHYAVGHFVWAGALHFTIQPAVRLTTPPGGGGLNTQ